MALTAPAGLSAAQKRKLKQNEPTMDDATGIPEAVATETDLNNVISDLASTAAGKGASCIGYEGGTTVQAQVAANTADIVALGGGGATPSTQLGIERHIKVSTAGGATADTDTVLPPGTWECTRAEVVNRAVGTAGDTIQVIAQGVGTITDAMDVNKADATITRPATLAAGVTMVGGTNALRVTETDGGGNDSPACDVHVWLRQVA